MKWAVKLNSFALRYVPLRAIKGQALVDLLAEHPCIDADDPVWVAHLYVNLRLWVLTFDESKNFWGTGASLAIINPTGQK